MGSWVPTTGLDRASPDNLQDLGITSSSGRARTQPILSVYSTVIHTVDMRVLA